MKIKNVKVYVGCGPDRKEGFIGCDIRVLDTVGVVCKSWELSDHFEKVHQIYSRHMLEHLTFKEVEATLRDWLKCLKVGGGIHLVVPFLDFHIEQWKNAQWSESMLGEKWSEASWSMAGLYGWQRECDPTKDDYNSTYWDVHKSGFNFKNMTFILERAGFSEINISVFDECHLIAKATKSETPADPNGISVKSNVKKIEKVVFGGISIEEGDEKTLLFDKTSLNLEPWNLSRRFHASLHSIECEKTLEFMTTMEIDSCLTDWHRALVIGGKVTFTVPNTDYFAKIWLQAEWTEADLCNPDSPGRISRRGLYGEQSKGNPKIENYDPSHFDIIKTPFNEKYLTFLLHRAGFDCIVIERPNPQMLLARAVKSMDKAERQVAPEIQQIREDHRKRYEFAATRLNEGDEVLDFACGVGYGANILSNYNLAKYITACDINKEALEYAKCHYGSEKIRYIAKDALNAKLPKESFDLAVSFETIEHLEKPERFLRSIHHSLKKNGILICSVPNELFTAFDKKNYPYHFRHYTRLEMKALLKECGFCLAETFCQKDLVNPEIKKGEDGSFLIQIATKE
jgi:predicted SAM-dependent methyltransferase